MKVNIGIDTKTFIRFWLVVIGFLLVGFAIFMARQGILIVLVSMFLAIALNPVVSKVASHLPGKSRTLATAVSYILVVGVLGTILFLIVPPIVRQSVSFIKTMPDVISQAVDSWSGFNDLIEQNGLVEYRDQALVSLKEFSTDVVKDFGSNIVAGANSVVNMFTSLLLTLVLTFLMLIQGPAFMRSIWTYFEKFEKTKRIERIIGRMSKTISNYVVGQLTVATIDGVVTTLVMFIFSFIFDFPADLAIPVAMIVAVMSLIPMFGATIGAIIAAILLAFNDFGAAIAFVIYFIIYQQIENNLIVPLVQSKSSKLPALVIFGSVIIGIYTFGLVGGIIAIPIAACIKILLEEFQQVEISKKEGIIGKLKDLEILKK
ncbi:MAG: AI-2E family transporter [Candidatus Nomurabacteria bacterium]|jgi:predicted PurR-regulated permease PerM|nr:AI-2E family transporter [Candidatus Nomurabacteria bacterium]